MFSNLKKSDGQLQIVWGELYVPGVPDADTHFMKSETVATTAYRWMAQSETRCIDIEHDGKVTPCYVVESFIARKGDPDFIEDAWVIGVHVPDTTLWDRVQKGEFNGFSLAGPGTITPAELAVPQEVTGLTKSEEDHEHEFMVKYDDDGKFVGGVTSVSNGHFHIIRRGTVTEAAAGHTHQYDFVRGLLNVDAAD